MPEEMPMVKFQIEERLAQLLSHLGLSQANFVARLNTDWTGLVVHHPDLITSLTLICPGHIDATLLNPLGPRLLVINDDHPTGVQVAQAMAQLPNASLVTLSDYAGYGWADIAADRPGEIDTALGEFVAQIEAGQSAARPTTLPQGTGEFAGITYHIRGSGPPLVLLPLRLAPSQWDPLLPVLSERYCTIILSGDSVGMVAMLEARGRLDCSDYLRMVRTMLDTVPLRPGDRVLEVGCGSGAISRWLAQHTEGANPIDAVDISPYLLREAQALATKEGVNDLIAFQEGDAESLPFADNRFQVVISCTVLEEGDANRMLAEMVRVTTPGGQVAIMVRGFDLPWIVNLELPSALKAKIEAPKGIELVEARGCADASLYHRMRDAGLTDRMMLPGWAAYTGPIGYFYLDRLEALFRDEERHAWYTAMIQAETAGTLFIAEPFHGAVGTKPSRA